MWRQTKAWRWTSRTRIVHRKNQQTCIKSCCGAVVSGELHQQIARVGLKVTFHSCPQKEKVSAWWCTFLYSGGSEETWCSVFMAAFAVQYKRAAYYICVEKSISARGYVSYIHRSRAINHPTKPSYFCQIGYISGTIYYLINGQKSLSWSETSLPDWKTDSSFMSYWKPEMLCEDGNAKWHLPLTSGKWRGLAWANELQNEYMFKPHLKWHLWHCHANLERIQSAGINSKTVIGLVKRPISF